MTVGLIGWIIISITVLLNFDVLYDNSCISKMNLSMANEQTIWHWHLVVFCMQHVILSSWRKTNVCTQFVEIVFFFTTVESRISGMH